MIDFKITTGQHKGEAAVVVGELSGGIKEVLTLGGVAFYDGEGREVCPYCQGTQRHRSIFGVMRCQRCLNTNYPGKRKD